MIHTSMFQKHIHKVKFYPSVDDFTQALLVMLVTNIMSGFISNLIPVSRCDVKIPKLGKCTSQVKS